MHSEPVTATNPANKDLTYGSKCCVDTALLRWYLTTKVNQSPQTTVRDVNKSALLYRCERRIQLGKLSGRRVELEHKRCMLLRVIGD
jgi:hypothetical protein